MYHITFDGRKINWRTANKAEAYREIERLLSGGITDDPFVKDIIDKFIEWSERQVKLKNHRSRTHATNAKFLIGTWSKEAGEKLSPGFRNFTGDTLVSELTAGSVGRRRDERYPDASENTRGGAMKAVKRVFSWAVQNPSIEPEKRSPVRLIESNPIADMKVPRYVPRRA